MKIISNKKYHEMESYKGKLKNIETLNETLNKRIEEEIKIELEIIDELYNIRNMLKQTIGKRTVKKHVEHLIKRLGGKI